MEVTWKEQRRGQSTLNLKFLVTSIKPTYDPVTYNSVSLHNTEPINVFNLALVRFKFKEDIDNEYLESYISVKKHESTKDSTISITISHEGRKKRCSCNDNWIENIKLEPDVEYINIPPAYFKANSFYIVEVNITAHTRTSELSVYRKLYEDTKLTDFHLTAKDGKVAVHKAVLGVHSEMFQTMLNGDWKETAMGCLSIDGVAVQTLENLKRYMYLRTLPDDCLQLQQLLLVAVCYLVDDLKADCIAELVRLVTPADFDAVVQFACQNNMPELIKAITDSIIDGINEMNDKKADTKNK